MQGGEHLLVAYGPAPDRPDRRVIGMGSGFATIVSADDLEHQLACAESENRDVQNPPANGPDDLGR